MPRHEELDSILTHVQYDLNFMKMQSAVMRIALNKNNDNKLQPRIPAGQSTGGRWTSLSGDHTNSAKNRRQQTKFKLAQNSQEFCDDQYKRDVFQCKMVGLRSCYAQAMVRLVACERGHSIPPLNY